VIYSLKISRRALKFLDSVPEKSNRILRDRIKILGNDPFPGRHGDKERLHLPEGYIVYRLHVGRSFTLFYRIYEQHSCIRILDIMTIEQAHKRYGKSGSGWTWKVAWKTILRAIMDFSVYPSGAMPMECYSNGMKELHEITRRRSNLKFPRL
jgi:mRNA-degrading endonuclease RelE of RelBE toxin-antitoxin system